MSDCNREYFMAPPCPQCGQQDEVGKWLGARSGSTEWGHSYSCCSEECGRAFLKNPKRVLFDLWKVQHSLEACVQQQASLEKELRELMVATNEWGHSWYPGKL